MTPITATVIGERQVRQKATMEKPDSPFVYSNEWAAYRQHLFQLPTYELHPSFGEVKVGQEVKGFLQWACKCPDNRNIWYGNASHLTCRECGNEFEEVLYPLPVEKVEDYTNDPFVMKHLKRIKTKMKQYEDAHKTAGELIDKHIKPLFNGLQKASVGYFVEKGTISGAFYEALVSMVIEAMPEPPPASSGKEQGEANIEDLNIVTTFLRPLMADGNNVATCIGILHELKLRLQHPTTATGYSLQVVRDAYDKGHIWEGEIGYAADRDTYLATLPKAGSYSREEVSGLIRWMDDNDWVLATGKSFYRPLGKTEPLLTFDQLIEMYLETIK